MYEESVGPVPARIYFCLVVVIGSIFLLNVVLAIVTDCYEQAVDEASDVSDVKIAAVEKVLKGLHGWVDGPMEDVAIKQMARKIVSGRRMSVAKPERTRIRESVQGTLSQRVEAWRKALTTRLEAIREVFRNDIVVNALVLHEKLGVGVVRHWDEKRGKWGVVFFRHHRLREAATSLGTLDEDAAAGLEAHRLTNVMAQRKLLLVPFRGFRMAAMEVFQSTAYQCFVTLCVLGNTIALSAYHFDIDVFTANYVEALQHSGGQLGG